MEYMATGGGGGNPRNQRKHPNQEKKPRSQLQQFPWLIKE